MDALKLLKTLQEKIPNVIHSLMLENELLRIQICDKSKKDLFGMYTLDENDLKKDIESLVDEVKQMEDNRK